MPLEKIKRRSDFATPSLRIQERVTLRMKEAKKAKATRVMESKNKFISNQNSFSDGQRKSGVLAQVVPWVRLTPSNWVRNVVSFSLLTLVLSKKVWI